MPQCTLVLALKALLRNCLYHFHFHLIGQKFVTWPRLASWETKKVLLFFLMAINPVNILGFYAKVKSGVSSIKAKIAVYTAYYSSIYQSWQDYFDPYFD